MRNMRHYILSKALELRFVEVADLKLNKRYMEKAMRVDKYDISASENGLNIVVSEVKIVTDKKSKNFGKEKLSNEKFYTSVGGFLRGIAQNELMASLNDCNGFKSVIDAFVANLSVIEEDIIKAVKGSNEPK